MTMRYHYLLIRSLFIISIICAVTSTRADDGSRKISFQDLRLKNGLRVVLSEDHRAPTYSIVLAYNVGSRDEAKGHTGFAHLFEHLMFEGSDNVGKGEHTALVDENGGTENGATQSDATFYFETLPANQLDLGLYLEADRMRSLAVTAAKLDNQREAVQEERRTNYDNQPYGTSYLAINDTVFEDFAYKHPVIGSMADLDAATLEDVRQFFKIYYAPNNAVLVLVGDFDAKVALTSIERYFGSIPSHTPPPAVDSTEPRQRAEHRVSIEDPFAPIPRLTILYKTVSWNNDDNYALQILFDILARGASSRLYQRLVKKDELAVGVVGYQQGFRDVGLAQLTIEPRPEKNLADIERVVYQEIARLGSGGPSGSEIDKARMVERSAWTFYLEGTLNRALMLGIGALHYNDPAFVYDIPKKYSAVTQQDIKRVARKYLDPSNRSVITTIPKVKTASGASGGPLKGGM